MGGKNAPDSQEEVIRTPVDAFRGKDGPYRERNHFFVVMTKLGFKAGRNEVKSKLEQKRES
jgi:hypothetical protein